MTAANTKTQYGLVAKLFHWLTAIGILLVIPLGIIANDLPYDTPDQLANKAWLFSLHKTIGITVFIVALARIAWALNQPKPAALHQDRKAETLLASIVHWLLYGSLVFVPLSGWIHHAATEGFAPIWWPLGQNLPLVPESVALADAAAGLHVVFERVLIVSLLLHIAGAAKHTFIDHDGTLARMWFGKSRSADAPQPAPSSRHGVSAALAILVWSIAIGLGGLLGVYQKGSVAADVTLQEVDSEWNVQDGAIGITVKQLGADVRGEFGTWTAQIAFDESVTDGKAGDVTVEIAIASLSLGSVTAQALGADYFNADAFPTAVFAADILVSDAGYVADGVLSLRGVEQPISLPFALALDGDTATIEGATMLNRQSYGIGDSMTDESQLAFEVFVNVELTATRALN